MLVILLKVRTCQGKNLVMEKWPKTARYWEHICQRLCDFHDSVCCCADFFCFYHTMFCCFVACSVSEMSQSSVTSSSENKSKKYDRQLRWPFVCWLQFTCHPASL